MPNAPREVRDIVCPPMSACSRCRKAFAPSAGRRCRALGLGAAWKLRDAHIAINTVLLGLPIAVTLLLIAPINATPLSPELDRESRTASELSAAFGVWPYHGVARRGR
jgi:hypothetical protein